MAVAAVTVTVTAETVLQRHALVLGTLAVAPAADTYAGGGLALGATEFLNKVVLAQQVGPVWLIAFGKSGYLYEFDAVAKKLIIRAQTNAAAEDAPLGELTVGAIPAGVSGDVINFIALFAKFPNV